jgi:DNA-binding MarR family transcriptional regulator
MHPLTYEAKRTHWNATWEAIRLYRACGVIWKEPTLEEMTPARFDILQTVWGNDGDWQEVKRTQGLPVGDRFMHLADVRSTLGLAGATVWKCVQKLVELEWITLKPCEQRKRRLVVHLTALGIHALRMGQRCAAERSIVVDRKPRPGFNRLVDQFVQRDAEAQGVVSTDVQATAPPRKSFGHWRYYYWWLIGHMRTMAKHFGCKAERLYHRHADYLVVRDEDDCVAGETTTRVPTPSAAPPATAARDHQAWWRSLLAAVEDEKFPP